MKEFDVGRALAAAAPPSEAVPLIADLPERARALGRRRRLRRAVMTGGGTGVALAAVVGVVVAAGGSGSTGPTGTQAVPGQSSATGTPTKTTATTPASPATSTQSRLTVGGPSTPSFPKTIHDPAADARLTTALNAALPAKWQGETFFRGAGTPGSYGAEYTWGSGQQEIVLDLSATNRTPTAGGTPTLCQEDPHHCTTGTATLLGQQVTWQYVAGANAPTMTVTDSTGSISYTYMFSGGSGTQLPGLDVMKDVALNDQVASALVAGIGSSSGSPGNEH